MKKIFAIIIAITMLISTAYAEKIQTYKGIGKIPYYSFRNVDDGETPVIIYIEGTGWRIEDTFFTSETYSNTNVIFICSNGNGCNFACVWREDEMEQIGVDIVDTVKKIYPKVTDVVNITFSNGGYGANTVYNACKKEGLKTLCAVFMDSVPRRFEPKDIVEDGIPIMICLSRAQTKGHITERTKEFSKTVDAKVIWYTNVYHGRLETTPEVYNDIYEYITGGYLDAD